MVFNKLALKIPDSKEPSVFSNSFGLFNALNRIQQPAPLPFGDLDPVGFEGTSSWIVFDEEIAVGQLGTDELFDFVVEQKLARKDVFHLVDPKFGHDQAITKVDAKLITTAVATRMLGQSSK
jgi:hypothetical protein